MDDGGEPRRGGRDAFLYLAIVIAAGCYFSLSGGGLVSEPPFADEAAVLAQSRYYRLLIERRFSDPDWIDHAAYDHQPLYKYAVGLALHLSGQYERIPPDLNEFKRWINGGVRAPEVDRRLLAARWVMLIGSSLAVGFVFLFTRRLFGTWPALLGAVVFVSSPLVYTHGRRAMIDLPATGLAVGSLWAASRFAAGTSGSGRRVADWLLFVLLSALAPLAKWNAAVGVAAAAAVGLLAIVVGPRRLTGVGLVFGALGAAALFVAMDPYYWAQPDSGELSRRNQNIDMASAAEYRILANASPWERGKYALDYRRRSMAAAKVQFPSDYLPLSERPGAIIRQGMGRWTLGNRPYRVTEAERPRAERGTTRDILNASILAPLTFIALIAAIRAGRTERRSSLFPALWLFAAWVGLDVGLLLLNLMVDWDRYYLGIVAWSSIGAAAGLQAVVRWIVNQLRLKPRELTPL